MEKLGNRYEPLVQLQNAELAPFTAGEEKFLTYNREEGNTCVGHIVGGFGNDGGRFRGNWSERETGRDTPEFQTELHSAVYALRQGLLKDHGSMLEYCQNHPEAKLPGRDNLEHYGFKLDTDKRQYFVFCAIETEARDSRFVIFAYDKPAPELEQAQTTVSYTLGELIKKMEPQSRRDKTLINGCVEGLGLYAAQLAQADNNSPGIAEMRDLAEQLVHYWGLTDDYLTENAKPLDEYMQAFDDKIEAVKSGYGIAGDIQQSAQSVIYGIYRYGEDMVGSQGEIAMSEIMKMSGLIKEIGGAWDFDSDILNNLTARLESEVRDMFENYPLPGNPVSGVSITDCKVAWAAVFDDAKIIALAQNPDAVFSVWEINELKPDFDSRRNFAAEEDAKINFIERVITHQNLNYGVKLKTPRGKSDRDAGEKQSVIEEIRAAQKAQKEKPQTSNPGFEKNNKKQQPDL